MKRNFLLLILVLISSFSGFSFNLYAQKPTNSIYPTWRQSYIDKLDEAQKMDRPLLERSIALAYFNQAETKEAFPLMGEGLAYLLRAQMKVASDSISQYLPYIDRMDAIGHTVSTKAISHLLRGNIYLAMLNSIPQIARQEYASKVLNAYRKALAPANDKILVTTSTRKFLPMMKLGTINQDAKSYPLYDAISRNVIVGMKHLYDVSNSIEQRHALLKEMSVIYSHWLELDKHEGYNDMALMIQMDYYDWAEKYQYELDKMHFPYLALPTKEAYQKCTLLPELYLFLADKLTQKENTVDFKTAIDYYKLIVKQYPKYRRTPNAKNKLFDELAPSFQLRSQRVFSTRDSIKIHLSYRNLDRATLIFSALESTEGQWTRNIPLKLESVVDGTMQDTIVTLAPCAYGRYTVRYKINLPKPYKTDPSTKKEKVLTLYVSDLMVRGVKYPDGRTQLRLVDKHRGAPISKGHLIIKEDKRTKQREQLITTNEDGAAFVRRKRGHLNVRATYKEDIYLPSRTIYGGNIVLPKNEKKQRATLLTDRKLYRPGDIVTVTAIAYERTSDEANALKQYAMSVELFSPNGKMLQTEKGITDDMGVMTLHFSLPEKMMKGSCRLKTFHPSGYASIQVEEYVAPTYEVTLQQISDTFELPRIVNCNVLTKLLSDVPLKDVALTYTLTGRKYPAFWGRRRSNYSAFPSLKQETIIKGQATTDAQGNSSLTLLVDSTNAIKAEYARYSLSIVAVSPTGERHETMCSFIGHYPDMKIKTDTENQTKKEKTEILPDSLRLPLWIASGELYFSKENHAVMRIHTNLDDAILHLRYISNKGVIEEKDIQVNNKLYTLEIPYEKRYGKSLTVQCSLIKGGTFYDQVRRIMLPLPKKKLQLKWMTFRDHLLPGQKEKFQLQILTPDGKPADASLWMTMYDASTDAIAAYTVPSRLNYYRKRVTIHEYSRYIGNEYNRLMLYWPSTKYVPLSFDRLISPLDMISPFVYYIQNASLDNDFSTRSSAAVSGIRIRGGASLKSAASPMMEMEEVATVGVQTFMTKMGVAQSELSTGIALRKKLLTTAFCYPTLRTDSLGCIAIPFEVPGDLTRWHMLGQIHTTDMMQGRIDTVLVSQRPLMIKPTKPRFLRVGDNPSLAVTVSNLMDDKEMTKVILTLFDAVTKKKIERYVRNVMLSAKDQQEITFHLKEIRQPRELLCRVEASNRVASDGEQFMITVEDNANKMVHTQPFMLMPGDTVVWKQPTIRGHVQQLSQSVHLTQGVLFTALQQLPRIWQAGGEVSTTDLLNRYYALMMGRSLIKKQPALKEWVTDQVSSGSMIRKQTDVLQLTPWEIEGQKQVKYWKMLASELETNRVNYLTADYRKQLSNMQQADGSFVWYPGMKSSIDVTLLVTNQLIRLEQLTDDIQGDSLLTEGRMDNRKIIQKAKKWLDRQAAEYVLAIKKQRANKKRNSAVMPTIPSFYPLQYLCLDSQLSDWSSLESLSPDARYLFDHIEKDPRKLSLRHKLFVSTIYLALHQNEQAKMMIASINEYSLYSEQPSILLSAMMVNAKWQRTNQGEKALSGVSRNIRELYLKALSIARTQHWYQPTAQADILAALLTDQTWTVSKGDVSFQGDKQVVISQESLQKGFVDMAIEPSKHQSNVLYNNSNEVLWGSFVTQYHQTNKAKQNKQTQQDEQKADSQEGLSMTRSLYLMDDSGEIEKAQKLTPGMEIPQGSRIAVLLQVASPTSLDMVKVEDHFAAGFMPVNQRSGYQWGGTPRWISSSWLNTCWLGVPFMVPSTYYEVNQSSICFYINRVKRGHYSLQYQLVAQQRGVFQGTTAQMVSLFAPDYHVVASIEQVKIVARDDK